ncbi:MAG: response regulator, partial [Proteobacteria bacterium]|nr:response regulator [Pseudomonadota bacterium]
LARELAEAPDRPQPAPAAPAGHAAAPAADPDLPPPLGGLRVLLAEDNPVNQMVVRGLLPGLPLDLAANGREALDLLQRAGPDGYDLVLMDVQMPELDGLEATRRLRTDARFAALPVVALTAHALPEEIDRCRAAGMDEHLAKPIDPPALYGTLRRLAMPRAERRQAAADAAAAPAPAAAQVPTGGNGGGSGGGGDWPSLPGIDRERARQHTGGKLDLYETLLAQFARDHLDADRRVRRLLAGSERLAAVRLAHTLKGSAGTLGAVRLQFRAAALESVLCRPDKPADEALADFAEAFAELRAGIEQWQAERQPVLDAVGPGAPRRDPAELAQQLALLIGDHDTSALAVAEQLVAACAGASLEAQVREMTQAVRNYDFTRAAALLRGSGLLGSRS